MFPLTLAESLAVLGALFLAVLVALAVGNPPPPESTAPAVILILP